MKKMFSVQKTSDILLNILYAFSAFCSVFAITEYFFDDALWGNQSFLNLIAFILIFALFKLVLTKTNKQCIACGMIFSILLSLSLIIGKCIYNDSTISSLFGSAKSGIIVLCSLYGFGALFYATFILMANWLTQYAIAPSHKTYKILHLPFLYGILMFLCWLPCYLAYYPGIFAYDIELQTMEALGTVSYSRFHPPLHTFIWNICLYLEQISGLNGLVIYSVLQMGIWAFALSCVLHFMVRRKYNPWLIAGSFCFFAFNPVIALFSFIPVKDSMLTAFFALFTVELYSLSDTELNKKRLIVSNIRLIIVGIVCCLLRNNVVYALIPAFLIMLFIIGKNWKRIALCGGSILVVFLLINGPIYTAMGVEKGNSREMLSVPMQQIAYVAVTNNYSLSPDELDRINQYIPTEQIAETYNPRFADPVKGTFITENFDQNPADFFKLWADLLVQYPEEYIVSFLNLNIPYWYPDANSVDAYARRSYIETTIPTNPMTEYVVIRDGKIPMLYEQYEKVASFERFKTLPIVSNIFSLSFPIWFLIFGTLIQIIKKEKKTLVVFLPALLLWCTFMLGPVSNLRYLLPIIAMYPLYFTILFSKNK